MPLSSQVKINNMPFEVAQQTQYKFWIIFSTGTVFMSIKVILAVIHL